MHRGDTDNEWRAYGDVLLLLGWEEGPGEQTDEERHHNQGLVQHVEERSRKGCVLD